MESISSFLSPYDDLEFICKEHGLSCIGICSNILCIEDSKLLCMKCIKSGKTCITTKKHELVTISEILYRFWVKEENKANDLLKIKKLKKIMSGIDEKKINDVIYEFSTIKSNKIFNIIQNSYTNLLNEIITSFKDLNRKKLEEIKVIPDKEGLSDSNETLLLKIKFPDIDKENLDNQKIIEFMNSGYKLTSPKEFINSIKYLKDTEHFSKIYEKMSKKIYMNNIINNKEKKKDELEKKIDSVLNDIEQKFDDYLKLVEDKIIFSKDNLILEVNRRMKMKFEKDPNSLEFLKDIATNAHNSNSIDTVFCAFKSFSGLSLVVWGDTSFNIDFYDFEKEKIISTINSAHSKVICSCRHYPDYKHSLDYVISSSYDKSVKVWDITTFKCIVNIQNAHKTTNIYSVSILFDYEKAENYVISSAPNEYMKIWDFNGNFIQNMGQNNESTYFIDVYYEENKKDIYILNANSSDVKSYIFSNRTLYKKYKGIPEKWHMSALVNTYNDKEILIESDGDGNIRMWEFHTSNLVKTIRVNPITNLRGICLWNDNFLFAAGNDYKVKLFNLKEGKFNKSFSCHKGIVCSFQKIKRSKYRECLISHGLDGKLKLWTFPNAN